MSTLKVNTIQNASGVEKYLCQAWVNFNGTGTVAIRASGNVSSITDNGTGDYTVNFTTAMPDANYCTVLSGGFNSVGSYNYNTEIYGAQTASAVRGIWNAGATFGDAALYCVAIFR